MKHPALLFIAIALFSCKKEHMCDCFKSTGEMVKEERSQGGFHTIELESNINLIITQDTFNRLEVEAGSHLINGIITEVSDSVLKIRNENRCNMVRSYKKPVNVYVSMPKVQELIHRGSGKISCTNTITGKEVKTGSWSSGDIELTLNVTSAIFSLNVNSGDITAKGFAGESYVYSAGNGFVNNAELETGYTFLHTKSTGECFIYVTKEFYPAIDWTGNVYYTGSPYLLEAELNGKGRLIAQ